MSAVPDEHRTVPRGYVYADHIPYDTPGSLDDLRGPTSGVVRVGPHIDTSLDPEYELGDRDRLENLYARVVRSGSIADQTRNLDRATLLRLWPRLNLPVRCRSIWEQKFPTLAARARGPRAA
ncbi:hypothetical protein ACFQHV_15370 [Promicromonospora thailandica]|uniref:Uncharacterized protein n=1 Tax=Promicromonospora thailandica TaxID=765201 RepID=A0A9X2JUI7_9MICO|nr:hypothetical protein [Promicromonospora thailandica]MCP2264555.1 hypothetical protein [Promicromonospora thailandica]BFF20377.1 hypothetical protein GCM10025730_38980 [Promicromonospora thailandica]